MTSVSTERAGFIRKICEEPFEDTHRLVFADFLEENDEWCLAELIRSRDRSGVFVELGVLGYPEGVPARVDFMTSAWDTVPDRHVLIAPSLPGVSYGVHRGFVSRIELPYEAFMLHHGQLFAAHPITSVKITDFGFSSRRRYHPFLIRIMNTETAEHHPTSRTIDRSVTYLPLSFKGHVRGGVLEDYGDRAYASLEEAQRELSAAFVRWGREKAGLPQLDPQEVPA